MNEAIKKRLENKFGHLPKWSEDFPIESSHDTDISRRDLIRYLFLVSAGFFTGTFGVMVKSIFKRKHTTALPERMKIIGTEDIAVGESYVFRPPSSDEPAILVRLSENQFVAFGQKCTHLQSPVIWKKEQNRFLCPCHKGAFAADTGAVLQGPPERALPKIKLDITSDGVYYAGMESGELS